MLTVVIGFGRLPLAPVPSTCKTKFSIISSCPATGAEAITLFNFESTMMRAFSFADSEDSPFSATPSIPVRIIAANSSAVILEG